MKKETEEKKRRFIGVYVYLDKSTTKKVKRIY